MIAKVFIDGGDGSMVAHSLFKRKVGDLVSMPLHSFFEKNINLSEQRVPGIKKSFMGKKKNKDNNSHQKLVSICFKHGCPRSKVDACLLVDYFRTNGWRVTNQFKKADIVLVSTCGVTKAAEDECLKYLYVLNRMKKKDSRIFAFGCLPGINGERVLNELNSDILTRSTFERLDSIIAATVGIRNFEASADLEKYSSDLSYSIKPLEWLIHSPLLFVDRVLKKISSQSCVSASQNIARCFLKTANKSKGPEETPDKKEYSIKISTGCLESCSYCAIRFASGTLKSFPLQEVLHSFDRALNDGYHLIRLLGEDVGGYGQDMGSSIVTVLRDIFQRNDDFKIIIDDFHPRWLIQYFQELSDIFTQNAHKIEHLGFPIQSGSNRVLQKMNREFRIEEIEKCLKRLKVKNPGLSIHTHLLVGFPGETEDDFKKTLELLDSVSFSRVCLFEYSDRPGTPAQDFPDKVPNRIIKRRAMQIRKYHKNQESFFE